MVWLASILEIYPLTVSKPEIRDWGGPSEVVGESLLPSSLLHCMVCWPSQVSWTCRSSAQSLFSSVYDVLPGCLSVSKFPLLIRTFVVVVQLLWDSPGKNTGVGCHFLLQGIFLTQGSNWCLLLGRPILYHWDTWEAFYKDTSHIELQVYPIPVGPSLN